MPSPTSLVSLSSRKSATVVTRRHTSLLSWDRLFKASVESVTRGPWIGINGQLAAWLSKLLVFIQYDISVWCKSAQWRVAYPVAFYTRRTTTIFGISGYLKLVPLYCHAIFWGTEGLEEGCVKILLIVSCLKWLTCQNYISCLELVLTFGSLKTWLLRQFCVQEFSADTEVLTQHFLIISQRVFNSFRKLGHEITISQFGTTDAQSIA